MKDYLIKHIEGIKYWKQHPELSATKAGEILHVDRHVLTKILMTIIMPLI